MLSFLILLLVIGGGVALAAAGWNRLGEQADEQHFRHQLDDLRQQPNPTPEQDAAQRDATYRWADDRLDQLRQEGSRDHD